MEKAKNFWDRRSSKYDIQVSSKYSDAYAKTIENTKKYLNNMDIVLDCGCGTGLTTIELSKEVKKIYAVDISPKMISIAESKANNKGISNIFFEVTDIFNDKFEKRSFDVILAFNLLYFVKDIDEFMIRINELLKPNGTFISATDCLGEKKIPMTFIQTLLSRIGLIPYMRKFKMSELEKVVEKGNCSIIETQNLYDMPPNYYIAARKK